MIPDVVGAVIVVGAFCCGALTVAMVQRRRDERRRVEAFAHRVDRLKPHRRFPDSSLPLRHIPLQYQRKGHGDGV